MNQDVYMSEVRCAFFSNLSHDDHDGINRSKRLYDLDTLPLIPSGKRLHNYGKSPF